MYPNPTFFQEVSYLADKHGINVNIQDSYWSVSCANGKDVEEAFYERYPDLLENPMASCSGYLEG